MELLILKLTASKINGSFDIMILEKKLIIRYYYQRTNRFNLRKPNLQIN